MTTWPAGAQAAVTFSFDDGYALTYENTALPLHQRGMCATYNLITDNVGGVFEGLPVATWQQWGEAVRLGHEIASHSATHAPMAGTLSAVRRALAGFGAAPDSLVYARQLVATASALRKWSKHLALHAPLSSPTLSDLVNSRLTIERHLPGVKAESFVFPAGLHQAYSRRLVGQAGFTSARASNMGLNDPSCDFFALRAITLGPGLEIEDLYPWLDRACHRRAWLIIALHWVAKSNSMGYPYFCSLDGFQRLLDAVQARTFWVATQGQVIRHWNQHKE